MKILHVNEHLERKGGVETYLLSLLPMLEARGIEGHVLYGQGDTGLWESSSAVPEIGLSGFRHDAPARVLLPVFTAIVRTAGAPRAV